MGLVPTAVMCAQKKVPSLSCTRKNGWMDGTESRSEVQSGTLESPVFLLFLLKKKESLFFRSLGEFSSPFISSHASKAIPPVYS
jgi:hypothetical protein